MVLRSIIAKEISLKIKRKKVYTNLMQLDWERELLFRQRFRLHKRGETRLPTLRKFGGLPFPANQVKRNRKSKKARAAHNRVSTAQKRSGGKSAPKSIIHNGPRTLLTINKKTGASSVIDQTISDWVESLSLWSSVDGDKKSPNPHSYTFLKQFHPKGFTTVEDSNTFSSVVGCHVTELSSGSVTLGSLDSNTYNTALSRMFEKVRGDVDLSIDLAEGRKTIGMMRDTVKGMKNLFVTFRKMRRSNPRDWGNLWLEFTYGWKPLASSIYGSFERYVNPKTGRLLRVDGSANVDLSPVNHSFSNFGGPGFTLNQYEQKRASARLHCEFQVAASRLNELAGYTSLNPVSIAWELIPYSFVVDWFLNVGGYLRNLESGVLYRSSFLRGYSSEVVTYRYRQTYSGANTIAGTVTVKNSVGETFEVKFQRKILSASPLPRPPSFRPQLGASRLISGAALLGQFVKSLEHPKDTKAPKLSDFERWLSGVNTEINRKEQDMFSRSNFRAKARGKP